MRFRYYHRCRLFSSQASSQLFPCALSQVDDLLARDLHAFGDLQIAERQSAPKLCKRFNGDAYGIRYIL